MRLGVVGHVEWVDFVAVPRLPLPGEVMHAAAEGSFAAAAGGGAVLAVQLTRLGGEVSFFTALGEDELGRRAAAELEDRGIDVHVAWRDRPTRRAVTLVEPTGERTIVTIGERLEPARADELPWRKLADAAGVYVTAGDAEAVVAARRAPVLTASPRTREALAAAGALEALIYSEADDEERHWGARLGARARLLVATEGARGGRIEGEGEARRWAAASLPGPVVDSYGCGDSFAAGFTFALARGEDPMAAAELGARCGAACLTGQGPYGAPLPLA